MGVPRLKTALSPPMSNCVSGRKKVLKKRTGSWQGNHQRIEGPLWQKERIKVAKGLEWKAKILNCSGGKGGEKEKGLANKVWNRVLMGCTRK